MGEIQTNAVIEIPKLGRSLKVRLPYRMQGIYRVYSLSSDFEKEVYFDPSTLSVKSDGNERQLVCSVDNLVTNGDWMQKEHGRRIS